MSMRVSRDSGRTWDTEVVVISSDPLAPLLTSAWPPCQCSRCMTGLAPVSGRLTGGTAQ